ncbi:MAG: serine hydrolase domain-containing protein [Candidatus Limnocylindrales bacterium]
MTATIRVMDRVRDVLTSGLTHRPRPLYPGAVAVVVRDGAMQPPVAVGHAVRYADGAGTELASDARTEVRPDTIFDVASLTKLFTATVVMGLVGDGLLDLDQPVAEHLPSFRTGQRREVTLRHILSHTSGIPDLLKLWTDWPTRAARRRAVLEAPLRHSAGSRFEYSCIGFMVAGFLAEHVTRRTLPELVDKRVCRPLGLLDTGFLPSVERLARVAATEYQPAIGRGMVQGSVHDENSWSLGGTAGNAGLFSTAADIARFGEAIRRGGEIDGTRILPEAAVSEMVRDQLPSTINPGFGHGLGFRIGAPTFMGALADSGAIGHTGFTGTSLVIDASRHLVVVLMTNRIHPDRNWSDIGEVRCSVAEAAAGAPPGGRR